jgi:hypothetical protein
MSELATTDYTVTMTRAQPRSIRFDEGVADRLSTYVAAHPGMSQSSVANRLVDEGLRMAEHPGVFFRDGASGRRAVIVAGADVWQIIRAVREARAAEPDLDPDGVLDLVRTNTGVSDRELHIAIGYWSAYPDEIDAKIAEAERFERSYEEEWRRGQDLLGR